MLSRKGAFEHFANSFPDAVAQRRDAYTADVVQWASKRFFVGPGVPIVLLPHQEALLRLFGLPRADGSPWGTQIYSTVKKSGKTTIAALLARFDAETGPPGRELYLAANDREQAQNRVFQAIRQSIEFDETARTRWIITQSELRYENGTFIRAISNDYRGEAGSNPARTCWTELWGFEHEQSIRLFEELTPVPTLPSVRFVETSAGYEGQSGLLWDLYALGMAGRQLTAGELAEMTDTPVGCFSEAPSPSDRVPVWLNEPAGLAMYWDEGLQARRMPWQRGADGLRYYGEQEKTLRPSQFRRLHLNRWAQSEEAFIQIEWWDACERYIPPPNSRTQFVIGVDGAVSGDSFAMVAVTRDPDDHENVVVRDCKVWVPPRGGTIDFNLPRAALREAIEQVNVVEVAYDPFQLVLFMKQFAGQAYTRVFKQGDERNLADRTLSDLIRDRRIAHSGVPEIRAHLLNANAKITSDSKMRIEKRAGRLKVDLAVALSMASSECLRLNLH